MLDYMKEINEILGIKQEELYEEKYKYARCKYCGADIYKVDRKIINSCLCKTYLEKTTKEEIFEIYIRLLNKLKDTEIVYIKENEELKEQIKELNDRIRINNKIPKSEKERFLNYADDL